jgi:catechol 2,3-dioxygenase-like lactoylglutathione lyase family enzyme
MTAIARLHATVLECPDPRALAEFYQRLTGWRILDAGDEWVTIGDGGPARLAFQRAPGHVAPTWPDDASSMQYHLDFEVDDLDAAEEQTLRAGATKFEYQPGTSFRVYADPAGHPFCLCA